MSNAPDAVAMAHKGVDYHAFMWHLSEARATARYLEVGVESGKLFEGIQADIAVGVDPAFALRANVARRKRRVVLHQMTSDAFFADPAAVGTLGGMPDLVFLDGLHHLEFLLRDVVNTEAIASPDTIVVLHDCLPLNQAMIHRDQTQAVLASMKTPYFAYWTGDVWKIVPILRKHRPDLRIVCLDCPPTGLVCLSGLDPASRVLADNAAEIVAEARALPNDWAGVAAMYAQIEIASSEAAIAAGLERFCR